MVKNCSGGDCRLDSPIATGIEHAVRRGLVRIDAAAQGQDEKKSKNSSHEAIRLTCCKNHGRPAAAVAAWNVLELRKGVNAGVQTSNGPSSGRLPCASGPMRGLGTEPSHRVAVGAENRRGSKPGMTASDVNLHLQADTRLTAPPRLRDHPCPEPMPCPLPPGDIISLSAHAIASAENRKVTWMPACARIVFAS